MKTHDDVIEFLNGIEPSPAVWEVLLAYVNSSDGYFRWFEEFLSQLGFTCGPSAVFEVYAYFFFELRRLLDESLQPPSEVENVMLLAKRCVLERFEGSSFTKDAIESALHKRVREYQEQVLPKCDGSLAGHVEKLHTTLGVVLAYKADVQSVGEDIKTNDVAEAALDRIMYPLMTSACTCAMAHFIPFLVGIQARATTGKPLSEMSESDTWELAQNVVDVIDQTRSSIKPQIEMLIANRFRRKRGCLVALLLAPFAALYGICRS